jgi:hypothetical protein
MGRKVPFRCSVRLHSRLLRPFSDRFSRPDFSQLAAQQTASVTRSTKARGILIESLCACDPQKASSWADTASRACWCFRWWRDARDSSDRRSRSESQQNW